MTKHKKEEENEDERIDNESEEGAETKPPKKPRRRYAIQNERRREAGHVPRQTRGTVKGKVKPQREAHFDGQTKSVRKMDITARPATRKPVPGFQGKSVLNDYNKGVKRSRAK